MNNRRPTYVKRKLSAKNWHSSYIRRATMDDRSSTQSFSNLHHHRHRPPFHLTLPSLQSPELGYPSSQPALDTLEHYGSRGEESTTSFPTSSTSSVGRRASGGGDRGLLNTSGLDGDANLGGHLDGESGISSHFSDTWYGGSKKEEVWEDGESCESTADDFYSKGDCYNHANDVFYTTNCGNEEGVRRKVRANYNNYAHVGYEAKSETVYNREANVSHFTKQPTSFNRSTTGSFSDNSVDYCRTDSRVSDNYLGREEDYGSSCGSGEDQLQPAEVEGPWLSVSPSSQTGESRWRGTADAYSLASGCLPPIGISSGTYTQKLDSFSEAFLSQRKRRFPMITSRDSSGQIWEFGEGRGESPGVAKSRHSCAFDSDYLPPSSSSPAHPSHASFPSPPTSSHLMSSVLSPPPTPLPPPSHSPSKMDSPGAFSGTGHSVSQGGESLGTLQFFPSRFQPLPSIHSSGMIWKLPLLPHSFPQSSGDPSSIEGNHLRSSHGGDCGNITVSQNVLQSPESSFLTSLHPASTLCPSNTPSLLPSFHLPSHPSHVSGQHYEATEKIAPYVVSQKVKNGPVNLNQPRLQLQQLQMAPLALRSKDQMSLEVPSVRGEEDEGDVLPYVNVGSDFQAELPPCFARGKGLEVWSPKEESPWEQLLWKPWDELEESTNLQDRVGTLLSMCSSSCLPGGGSNTELALHCLHYCQGNTMATLEMLLFSQPSPTGDYHYSGSDSWTDSEKSLFSAALGTYGKEFSLIQKMVKTKTACQCVEFFYLSKRIQDKQKKQKEEESKQGEMEQQKSITPTCQPVNRQFGLEEAVPVPSLASFFPCKLCGKMFYKIKSRNAHMKIHRQPQEDWTDRRLQHQLLAQRLALSRTTNIIPTVGGALLPPQVPARSFSSSGLPATPSNNSNADSVLNSVTSSNALAPSNTSVLDPSTVVAYSNIAVSNSHVITNIDGGDSNQREPTTVLPFHQTWGSFGHGPDPVTFYCTTEGKDDVAAGAVGGKESINWP
ncbi:Zinc finger protein 541 [Larimichthys crocea]|uniref:Zinc finger protein 541 n=1 Tax=Larimichthys crocea TaxID=215358 RepID=A0A6G0HIE2_LARCR|nr:Zinc finger protein 541 [Larimichthys crocea]